MQDIECPKQLQRRLDRFVDYYNEVRPHPGHRTQDTGGDVPRTGNGCLLHSSRWATDGGALTGSTAGRITLRHRRRLHHIGIGSAYAGWRVAMLVDGLDDEIAGFDGSPLRRFVLDPAKDYQRIT